MQKRHFICFATSNIDSLRGAIRLADNSGILENCNAKISLSNRLLDKNTSNESASDDEVLVIEKLDNGDRGIAFINKELLTGILER